MKNKFIALFFIAASATALSQESGMLEEVVVTARKSSADYYGMPSVTLKKPADFLVQKIRLINDSRSPDLRKKEIIGTIELLLKASKKAGNIQLSYEDGFLAPVNLNDESLQIIEDKRRPDTSTVDIYAKIVLREEDNTKEKIMELKKFVDGAKMQGRTELEPQDDIGLSIVSPERFRYEVISKIAKDNARLVQALGGSCELNVIGLEGRVEWTRTDVAELTLYIPYRVEAVDCNFHTK